MRAGSAADASEAVDVAFDAQDDPVSLVVHAPSGLGEPVLWLGGHAGDGLDVPLHEAAPGSYRPSDSWADLVQSHPPIGSTTWEFVAGSMREQGTVTIPASRRHRELHAALVRDLMADPGELSALYDLGGLTVVRGMHVEGGHDVARWPLRLAEECLAALADLSLDPDAAAADEWHLACPRRVTGQSLVRAYLGFARGAVTRLSAGRIAPTLLPEPDEVPFFDTPANRTARRIAEEFRDAMGRAARALHAEAEGRVDAFGPLALRDRLAARRLHAAAREHEAMADRLMAHVASSEPLRSSRRVATPTFDATFALRAPYRKLRSAYVRLQRWRRGAYELGALRSALESRDSPNLATLELAYERFVVVAVRRVLRRCRLVLRRRQGPCEVWAQPDTGAVVELWREPHIHAGGGDVRGVVAVPLDGDRRTLLTPDVLLVRRPPRTLTPSALVIDATLSTDPARIAAKWRYGARLASETTYWMGRTRRLLVCDWSLAVQPFGAPGLGLAPTRRDWGNLTLRPDAAADLDLLERLVRGWLALRVTDDGQ